MKNNKGTFKQFWDGPLTWVGGVIVGGAILQGVIPRYVTVNVHPDLISDNTCLSEFTKAHNQAMEDGTWYTEGKDYSYLRATMFIPCQQKLEAWYMKHHPEYNRKVNVKDIK